MLVISGHLQYFNSFSAGTVLFRQRLILTYGESLRAGKVIYAYDITGKARRADLSTSHYIKPELLGEGLLK